MGSRKELLALQSLPLDIKVEKSKARIREWHDYWGGLVYVAFSGGKDSTVLKHLVDSIYSDVPAVYINTGLDLPEVRSFALRQKNAVRIDPRLRFAEIVRKYGFPVVSKEQSQYIYEFRRSKSESFKRYRWDGVGARKSGKIAERWKFLVNAPFPVSHMCCYYLKKEPAMRYERERKAPVCWPSRRRITSSPVSLDQRGVQCFSSQAADECASVVLDRAGHPPVHPRERHRNFFCLWAHRGGLKWATLLHGAVENRVRLVRFWGASGTLP